MPNNFLESYFKSRELTQQQKLAEQQLVQRQAEQAQQLGVQQQQLGMQAQGMQLDDAFRKAQAAQAQKQLEFSQQSQLRKEKLDVMLGIGGGQLAVTPKEVIPFVPGVIGMQQPPRAGEMDFEGLGRLHATTPVERAAIARGIGLQDRAAEQAQSLEFKQQAASKILQTFQTNGVKLSDNQRSAVLGMALTGAKIFDPQDPNTLFSFVNSYMPDAVKTALDGATSGTPQGRQAYQQLTGVITGLRDAFINPPAAAINDDRIVQERKDADDTYALLNTYYGASGITAISGNHTTNLTNLQALVRQKLGPRYNSKAADQFARTIETLKPDQFIKGTTPAQNIDWDAIDRQVSNRR